MPPASLIFSILKVMGPTVGKPAAKFAADQLNKRRDTRLGRTTSSEAAEAISAEDLARLCPPQKPQKIKVVYRPSRWQYLSSMLIGAGLTTIVGLMISRRS